MSGGDCGRPTNGFQAEMPPLLTSPLIHPPPPGGRDHRPDARSQSSGYGGRGGAGVRACPRCARIAGLWTTPRHARRWAALAAGAVALLTRLPFARSAAVGP